MDKDRALTRGRNVYQSVVVWSLGFTLVAAFLLEVARSPWVLFQLPVFYQLIYFDDRFVLWLSAALIVVAFLLAPRVRMAFVERLLSWVDRFIIGISITSFAVFGLGALLFYHRHPLSLDEFSLVYQSQVFVAGKLDGHVSPVLIDRLVAPRFIIEFFGIDRPRGLITSVYWPGTSLLMMPFTALGVTWLFNPFISALTVFCLHRATRQATDSPQVASWATLFLLASPVFAINALSFYAMPAHMLANVLFFWSVFHANTLRERGDNSAHKRQIFVAGVIGGFALVLHNPIPHLAFCAPWLIWVVSKRRDWILPLLAGYLIFALPLGVGWFVHLKTLDAQMPELQGSILARLPQIFVLPSGELLSVRLLAIFKILAWAVPGLIVLAMSAWPQARANLWMRLLTSSLATLFCAYFFISYPQGHGWGYRFIHPAWFVFPVIAAFAIQHRLNESKPPQDAAPYVLRRQFFAVAVALSLFVLLPIRAWQANSLIQHILTQIPGSPLGQKSILFINTKEGYYTSDLVQNDPFLRNTAWKLIARDPVSDVTLARQFLHSPTISKQGSWGELVVEGK